MLDVRFLDSQKLNKNFDCRNNCHPCVWVDIWQTLIETSLALQLWAQSAPSIWWVLPRNVDKCHNVQRRDLPSVDHHVYVVINIVLFVYVVIENNWVACSGRSHCSLQVCQRSFFMQKVTNTETCSLSKKTNYGSQPWKRHLHHIPSRKSSGNISEEGNGWRL